MKIHYLEATQNKERKNTFRKGENLCIFTMYTTYMKIHYLEAKQNKEKKITGKTCEFSQCIITYMKIHYLEAKQNKENKIHFAKEGKTCEF
jgi:hypothetical protein